ncbi:tail fiber assembly protein [Kluyvera georgiana]|uniref:tail fiber assembly protein n=1 Tax=Kluyvera georgiana TaxID=73098 RepID=UPI003D9701FC
MAALFDKNGNATETHIATVSSFAPVTGEFKATYDVRVLAGTGIPAYSTLSLAPVFKSGQAACWNGKEWQLIADLRGNTAYRKSDGSEVIIKSLGELDDDLTDLAPSTPYDQWSGTEWVTDEDTAHAAEVVEAEQYKQRLITAAQQSISLLQTKLLMARTLTDAETNKVNKTLDYIDAVEAIDTATAPGINFPQLEV